MNIINNTIVRKNMKKLLVLSVFLLSISISPVHAYYVDVEWEGSLHSIVSVDKENPFNAGLYAIDFYDDNQTNLLFTRVGFCVEPYTAVNDEIGSLVDVNTENLKKASWLMSTQWNSSSTNEYEHTGLQLAIWGVFGITIHDNSQDSYDFYSTYISNLNTHYNGSTFSADGYQVVSLPNYQDMLIQNPVPEPATMLLFGIGLLGITAVGRKKRFKA